MSSSDDPAGSKDPYNLRRFIEGQQVNFEQALEEIKRGNKRSHWMWYVFPQFDGLGFSSTTQHFAIKSLAEAKAYLEHPLLGPRLLACAEAVNRVDGRSAAEIFGSPDDMKLKSCATLFACVSPDGSVFHQLLAKYFRGGFDPKTLELLGVEIVERNFLPPL